MSVSPQLSATQRAYLFDRENFLARLQERANTLFENGYTVAPTAALCVFAVLYDTPGGERSYLVNPVCGTCTCPFFTRQETEPLTNGPPIPCKHLRGLKQLIRCTRERYQQEQSWGCYFRLRLHWIASIAEGRRLSLEGWEGKDR